MTFVSKIVEHDGGEVRYITAMEKGKPAWYFVRLFPECYSEYKKTLKKDSFALTDFGEILLSGWGEKAPPDILREMKEKYDVAG